MNRVDSSTLVFYTQSFVTTVNYDEEISKLLTNSFLRKFTAQQEFYQIRGYDYEYLDFDSVSRDKRIHFQWAFKLFYGYSARCHACKSKNVNPLLFRRQKKIKFYRYVDLQTIKFQMNRKQYGLSFAIDSLLCRSHGTKFTITDKLFVWTDKDDLVLD